MSSIKTPIEETNTLMSDLMQEEDIIEE
jgi:hypothetical protein